MPRYALLIRNDGIGAGQMLVSGAEGAHDQRLALECYGARIEYQCALLGSSPNVPASGRWRR